MKKQYQLQRIDLKEIPFRTSLPLIQLNNIEKLILKKLESHSKDSTKFPVEQMNNLISSGNLVGQSFLPAGVGGIFGLAAFLVAEGVIQIAKHAHKTAIKNALSNGINNSVLNIRRQSYEKAINAIKYALDQTEKYTPQRANKLFKLSKQHKELIAELKILLKYNLAVAYYQSFLIEYKENGGGRKNLDQAILWLIQTENEIEKLCLRPNEPIKQCLAELLLHSAALANNEACDAAERDEAKEAISYLSAAISSSVYIGFEYRDLIRKEPSPTDSDAIKIRRIIQSNWDKVKQDVAYTNEHRYSH